jgi:DNA-binding CsgD family transcriptional regulator
MVSIVGRDHELAIAREVVEGLPGGPRALLIEGDAGIGKTAVWRAALESAGRALMCVADEADARLSFAGLADLLRDVADDVLPVLPPPQREALEVALVRRASASGRPPDPMAAGVALRSVLAELANDGPLVVAVDDAQWLDAATARALAFATRRLQDRPVGVVATVRAPLTAADPLGLERAFGERLHRVRLGGLGIGALRGILEEGLGRAYPRPTLRRIARASGGNPLYALEIARALGPSPALRPGAPLPVPDSLRELVAARVAAVPPAARGALLAAAALSQPRARLVEHVASAEGLLAAEDAGLVRVAGNRVRFEHPLYASAIYAAAASGRRRELHARLAELVEDSEERVRHLALATAAPDEAVAAALADAAAGARARGAWDAAGELLEQASMLTPLEDRARERAVRAAEHHIHAGDRPRARALLERVLDGEPPGARRADALRLLSSVRYHEDSFADAARLLDEALTHARDPAQVVPIELGACHMRCHLGHLEAADAHAARAVALARGLGDARLGEALALRAFVDLVLARVPDRGDVKRALALEDGSRLLPLELRPSMVAAQLAAYSGLPDEARDRLEAVRAQAGAAGDESDLAHILCWLAWVETLGGDLARACGIADEALEHAALTGSEANRAWVLAHRALARAYRGDAAEALSDAADAAAIAVRLGYPLPLVWTATAVAVLELSRGNAAAAWAAARPVVEESRADETLTAYLLPPALDALIELGELERAERLLLRLDRCTAGMAWGPAAVARLRAALAAASGDLDAAEVQLTRAHAAAKLPFERAQTLLVEARVRRRRRRKRAARESLAQALALFEGMAARLWADRTREELARVSPGRAPGELTASERRVAQLAAEGRSNKQIASALSMAVHTVEVHLSRTYAKLGVGSRAQLARPLARLEVSVISPDAKHT